MDNHDKEIYDMINNIIYKENLNLLKKIAKDFNRDGKKLIDNYKNNLYK
jgi:iron uptake system EfeUOB component EfeO/EfeM|tara:strand:+ start:4113 stop:4259 length:147 start_codon:yes stop_codon:yes gene_type:complete